MPRATAPSGVWCVLIVILLGAGAVWVLTRRTANGSANVSAPTAHTAAVAGGVHAAHEQPSVDLTQERAASMLLIGMGAGDRAQRHPLIPLLATAKLAYDPRAADLTVAQISKHRALCAWCLAAAAASAAAVLAALPEARPAWKAIGS